MKRVKEVSLAAYAHQDIPFEKLVEELEPERSLSHTPLFQVMLMLQNTPPAELELAGLRLESFGEAESGTAKFDLTVMLSEDATGIAGLFEYNTDLLEASTIERMVGHFEQLLESIVANPEARISELQLLSPAEERHCPRVQRHCAELPQGVCLHQFIEQQAHTGAGGTGLRGREDQLPRVERES